MKTSLYHNNRQRASHYVSIKKNRETRIRKKLFKEPERGGLRPDINIDTSSIDDFIEKARATLPVKHADLFIDTSGIFGVDVVRENNNGNIALESLFDFYQNLIEYANDPGWSVLTLELYDQYTKLAQFYSGELFNRKNVFIIKEVLDEIKRTLNIVKNQVNKSDCKKYARKFTKPIENIYFAAEENENMTKWLETDPLSDIIYSVLPTMTPGGSLSRTDRRLIAIPLARSLRDGREKVILTKDRGIREALKVLSLHVTNENIVSQLELHAPPEGFKQVTISTAGLRFDLESRLYLYATSHKYHNFFNK
ncbi:MAG: hypothetical protein AABX08_03680 [Nanoarchaeota archaeon]